MRGTLILNPDCTQQCISSTSSGCKYLCSSGTSAVGKQYQCSSTSAVCKFQCISSTSYGCEYQCISTSSGCKQQCMQQYKRWTASLLTDAKSFQGFTTSLNLSDCCLFARRESCQLFVKHDQVSAIQRLMNIYLCFLSNCLLFVVWKSSSWGRDYFRQCRGHCNSVAVCCLWLSIVGFCLFSLLLFFFFRFSIVVCFQFSLLLFVVFFSVVLKSSGWWNCRQQCRGRGLFVVCLSISLFVCLSVCFLFSVSLLLFYVCFLCFIYCCCREIQRLMGLSSTVQRPQQLRCFTPTAEA